MLSSDARLGYVAGFIDGEGCICITKKGKISLDVVNTSKRALEMVLEVLGVGIIEQRKQRINKTQYQYRAYGDNCIAAVTKILPYLIDKKDQALLLLEYRQLPGFIRIPGRKGCFSNPERIPYITKMSEMKRYED